MENNYCINCGAKLAPQAKFCFNCGAKVEELAETNLNTTKDNANQTDEEEINRLLEETEIGNSEKQFSLYNYYSGKDNQPEALKWLTKAARGGNEEAQYTIGKHYFMGTLVNQDYKESERWFNLAAQKGHPVALYNLGIMNLKGVGVEENTPKAIQWFEKALDKGYTSACTPLGLSYYEIEQYEKAIYYLEKVVDKDDRVWNLLGMSYYNMKNFQKAIYCFENLASEEKGVILLPLGDSYFQIKEVQKAIACVEKAAEAGIPYANMRLSQYYAETNNIEKAVSYLMKAADEGDEIAQSILDSRSKHNDGTLSEMIIAYKKVTGEGSVVRKEPKSNHEPIKATPKKAFLLYGQQLEFSQDRIDYNKWRLHFDSLAAKYANQYMSQYYQKYGGLDDFAGKGYGDGWRVIGKALSETIQICVNHKRFDIDENYFLDHYGEDCFSYWVDSFYEINDKYMEIVLKSDQLDAYRTQRRLGRGRIIGGGFGLEGAIKGIATAGGINMAAGAVHGAFNLVGKGITMVGNSIKKSNVYNSEETKNIVWSGIYRSIFVMHTALCDILGIPFTLQVDKANSLWSNIGRMQKKDVFTNIVNILSLNPYKKEVYEFCIEAYGDEEGEVQIMADFFGINAGSIKKRLLENVFNGLNLRTENSTMKAKATINEYIARYGLKNSPIPTPFLREINTKLQAFDQEARNVDGVVFTKREEANVAAKELTRIKEIMSKDYAKSEEKALAALKQLREAKLKSSIAEKYIKTVEDVVAGFDLKARTLNEVVYDTREEAELARSEDKELQAIMKSTNLKNNDEVIKAIEAINAAGYKTQVKDKYLVKLNANKEWNLKDKPKANNKTTIAPIKEPNQKGTAAGKYKNRGIIWRFFRGLTEIIIVSFLLLILVQFGVVGLILAGLLILWRVISWSKRRKDRKGFRELQKQLEQNQYAKYRKES
jgi:TPR repeat protein